MTTPKKAAANRLNALKSTGPRTQKGLAITRLNSIRNGLYARPELMPAEDWQELLDIRDRFIETWRPQSKQQLRLVGRAACAEWKVLHWRQVHVELLRKAMEAASPARGDRLRADFAEREARLERRLREAYEALEKSAGAPVQQPEEQLPAA